jgi:hypothetical protein
MFIIFDTNIWLSELGLNSAKGAATRFFVKNKGAKVVLPEVVKLEAVINFKNELSKYIFEIEKNYQQLLSIFGKLKEIVLPSAEDIDHKVESIFAESQLEIMEIPFCLESARNSFLKTINKSPPSDKNQQFKDGVIWADCVSLLKEDIVWFVTADKAFYQNRQYDKGLAKTLSDEIEGYENKVVLFPSVSKLIEEIKTEIEIDQNKLIDQFLQLNNLSIKNILKVNNFVMSGESSIRLDIFATEDASKLYLEFEIQQNCEDISTENRSDAKILLKGDCGCLLPGNEFTSMRNYGEELVFKTQDGEIKNIRNIVIFAANLVIGHKTIEHSIRYKID